MTLKTYGLHLGMDIAVCSCDLDDMRYLTGLMHIKEHDIKVDTPT